jgi:glutathione S-transferase kappa 1
MAVRTSVKFYYDILSPYSWFGFETLCRYQKPWNLDLQLRPMNIWKIIKESGNTGPWRNPSKLSFINRDLIMVSEMLGVPYKPIGNIAETLSMRGSFPTLKALAACQIMYPDHLEDLSRQSWYGMYSEDIDITDEANIRRFARDAQIPDIDELIRFSNSDEAKQKLADNTAEALESKCYGAPWFIVTHPETGKREKFFGHDRVEMLGWVIGKEYVGYHPRQ